MKKQGRCDSADSNSLPNSHQSLVDVLDKELGFTAGHGHESPRGDTPPEAGGTNCMALALTLSLLFNVLFVILCVPRPSGLTSHKPAGLNGKQLMEWSRRAALEAEAASAFKCSGHGQLFVDTLMEARESNSTPVCECNDCFTGDDCSEAVPECRADSSSGDPLMFEAFWKRNAEASAVVIPGWYSMSYKVATSGRRDSGSALGTLERQIRAVHELVGNAVTEGRHIVSGTGSAQLVAAAINSISQLQAAAAVCEEPTKVVAPAPYCNSYASQIQLFRSTCLEWAGDARQYAAADHGDKVQNGQLATAGTRRFLEIVASPNNPDGKSQEAVLSGNGTRTVYDLSYYWPHFTPISGPADHDVMLFSLSKLTGHAGSRIGWALVKDREVAEKMNEYVWSSTMGVSHESQLRATQLLRTVMSGYTRSRTSRSHRAVQELSSSACEAERHASPAAAAAFCHSQPLFHYAHALLSDRWERLRDVLFASSRFKLQKLESQNCTFFGQLSSPSPAFAWIQCTRESERDCAAVLREAGIVGESGSIFGADASFVRLSLMNREQVFQNVLTRLRHFADPDAVVTTRSSSSSEQASS